MARQHAPPGLDYEGPCGNIAAGPANALPRYRFRQHLNQRTRRIHGIGIDHAVARLGHGVAGLDPDRRCCEWQRRIGRGPDEIVGAQRPAIGGGDILWRICFERRHLGGDAAQRLGERNFVGATGARSRSNAASATSSGVSEAERRWVDIMRRMVDQASSLWQPPALPPASKRNRPGLRLSLD